VTQFALELWLLMVLVGGAGYWLGYLHGKSEGFWFGYKMGVRDTETACAQEYLSRQEDANDTP